MAAPGTDRGAPAQRGWMVAVRGDHQQGIGAGVVVDAEHVLTCAHVVRGHDQAHLTVAFPHADNPFGDPLPVTEVHMPTDHRADVALLRVGAPMPAGVEPAPLRRPDSAALVGQRWWAYGFEDDYGHEAHGDVRAEAAYGWVELGTVSTREVTEGFSGAALWSPEYEAVVALVGQARTGGGRAFTLRMAATALPELDLVGLTEQWSIASAGADAVAHWGWTLARDEEGRRHWRPRARGVASDQQEGYRFRGRRVALTEIVDWLGSGPGASPLLVVTGSPGVGKSAVLARVVTTSDPAVAAELPADDDAVRAPLDAVSCAVHVKGKTALDVATEVARAASAPIPDVVEGFVDSLLAALADGPGTPFVVVVDALDEATSGQEARVVVDDLLVPLAERGAVHGVRVLVGSRKRDELGDLLGPLRAAGTTLDLDDDRYLERTDVVEYALATLALRGDASRRSVYRDEEVARPVAERIADVADGNFLVAGLVAHRHGRYDTTAVAPGQIRLPSTDDRVGQALRDYLDRVPDLPEVGAEQALAVLATAEAPGFSGELWRVAMKACTGAEVSADDLEAFATSSAANFLIETTGIETTGIETTGEERRYRLFHQALNDALAGDEPQRHLAVTQAFLELGARVGWDRAPSYLLRSLPHHALAAGRVDLLLADPTYLLHADLRRVITASSDPAAGADTAQAQATVRLIRRTPGVFDADPAGRLALLSVTEVLAGAARSFADLVHPAPYRARWADVTHGGDEHAIYGGHTGAVTALGVVVRDGREHLVSGGADGLLVVWDPATDEPALAVDTGSGAVRALCVVHRAGAPVLAAGGTDEGVGLWDPVTGALVASLPVELGTVRALCPVRAGDGDDLLAVAGEGGAVTVWDPLAQRVVSRWAGNGSRVRAVTSLLVDGRPWLAAADGTGVTVWDAADPDGHRVLAQGRAMGLVTLAGGPGRDLLAVSLAGVQVWDVGRSEVVAARRVASWELAATTVDARPCVVIARFLGGIHVWDVMSDQLSAVASPLGVEPGALCCVHDGDRQLVAAAGEDGRIRVWDMAAPAGTSTAARSGRIGSAAVVRHQGRAALMTVQVLDNKVRLTDPEDGSAVATFDPLPPETLVTGCVADGSAALLTTGDGQIHVVDLDLGQVVGRVRPASEPVGAVAVIHLASGPAILMTTDAGAVVHAGAPARRRDGTGPDRETARPRFRRPALPRRRDDGVVLLVPQARVSCPVRCGDHDLLAVADGVAPIRLLDPHDGREVRVLDGAEGFVLGLHRLDWGDTELLAGVFGGSTIRTWDPATGALLHSARLPEVRGGSILTRLALTAARGRTGARLLVLVTEHDVVLIWDIDRDEVVTTIPLAQPTIGVAVLPGGRLGIVLRTGLLVLDCAVLADEQPVPDHAVRGWRR